MAEKNKTTLSVNGRQRVASPKRKSRSRSARKGKGLWINPLRWPVAMRWVAFVGFVLFVLFLFYFFFVGPTSFRWKGLYGDVSYPEGYQVQGIDISHYQGNIDWEKLRNASINHSPVHFVFIKATEGVNLMDDYFNHNFYQARENGFIRGAYHFFSTKTSGKEQARYFLRQVHLEDGDLPPVLDIETVGKLTPQQIKKEVLDWLNVVEAHYQVKPIIYTNYRFKQMYLNDAIFQPYPYWIAHYYVDKVRYEGEWKIWQYTDMGEVDGIQGRTDLNIFNGSLYELVQMTLGTSNSFDE